MALNDEQAMASITPGAPQAIHARARQGLVAADDQCHAAFDAVIHRLNSPTSALVEVLEQTVGDLGRRAERGRSALRPTLLFAVPANVAF